jgi:RNA polymerase sigma-70 factor (ECF subfamily)
MSDRPYADLTDNGLVELSKENPDAFGELVARYQERMFRYARRMSYFSEEDLEDLVQEAFVKAYRGLNAFDGDLQFSTWMYRIARNTVIDAIRRKQARPQTVRLDEDDAAKLFRSDIDLRADLEAKDCLALLRGVIGAMPPAYREVLVLRFLEEKSYEEIMDIVRKPKGTVAALINRGRKQLLEEAERLHIKC